MGSEPDYSAVGTVFFHDGYRLASEYLKDGTSRSALIQLMSSVYESVDGLIDSFTKRCEREGLAVDCRKGCSFCCSQAVLASPHEVLAIHEFLRNSLSAGTERIKMRAADKHSETKHMSAKEFLHFIHPCPFLEHGDCLVYPVRPMACRCYLSSDAGSCRDQYENPEDRKKIAALYDFPLKAGRSMNEGIRSALMEKGLVPSEWLLETFMAAVFEREGILASWLEGNTPFNIRRLTPEENRYLREYYDIGP